MSFLKKKGGNKVRRAFGAISIELEEMGSSYLFEGWGKCQIYRLILPVVMPGVGKKENWMRLKKNNYGQIFIAVFKVRHSVCVSPNRYMLACRFLESTTVALSTAVAIGPPGHSPGHQRAPAFPVPHAAPACSSCWRSPPPPTCCSVCSPAPPT